MEKQQQQQQDTTKAKQQLLAEEVFSRQITRFRRERTITLYKDVTWLVDLIDKSSLKNTNLIVSYINCYSFFHKI